MNNIDDARLHVIEDKMQKLEDKLNALWHAFDNQCRLWGEGLSKRLAEFTKEIKIHMDAKDEE